jgi:hypothetical protein
MNPLRNRGRLLNKAKRLALGWSILCAAGATIGGIVGWVSWDDDRQ